MEAVRMLISAQLQRRWRGWLALALAIGLGAGAVITAAAGARRSATAYERLVEWSDPFHAATGGGAAGEETFLPGIAAMEKLPQVADSVRFYAPALELRSARGKSIRNLNAVVVPPEIAATIDYRVKYVRGRAPRPDRPDEASIGFAAETDELGIGDVVQVVLYKDQDNPSADKTIPVRIVGVHAAPDEFPSVNQITFPSLGLSPAFFTAYRDYIPDDSSHMALAVHLKHGAAGFPAFRDAVIAQQIPIDLPVALTDTVSGVQKTLRFESSALWLLAGLLALAAFAIFGQALGRQAFADHRDNVTLGALGMTRTHLFAAGLARAVLMGVVAVVVAVPTAVVASTLTPIGIARVAEPFPGIRVDTMAILIGGGITLALVVVAAAPGAFRAAAIRPSVTRGDDRSSPARLAGVLARAGAPVAAVSGARMASESGARRRSIPIRSAIFGAAVGVAALVMSFVFVASLRRLVDDPRLSGMVWDVQVAGSAETADALAKDPRVLDVGRGGGVNIQIGNQRMLALTFEEHGSIRPVIVEGRAPRGDDEIALGRTTMRRIDAAIGSTIRVFPGGSPGEGAGDPRPVDFRVVGQVIVPGFFFETHEPGVGAAFTAEAASRIDPPSEDEYSYLIRFAPGVTLDDVLAGPHGGAISETIFFVVPTLHPADLAVLKGVSNIPVVLSGLLAAMAAATLAHSIVTSVRLRRSDLAILKTLGFVRRQARAAVAWQTSIMLVVALIVGIPTGLVAGRWLWRVFVDGLALLPEPRVSALAVALTAPGALVLANVIAAGPARTAARTRPALVLRAE